MNFINIQDNKMNIAYTKKVTLEIVAPGNRLSISVNNAFSW